MRKSKKALTLVVCIAAVALLALFLVGCSSSNPPSNSQPTAPSNTSTSQKAQTYLEWAAMNENVGTYAPYINYINAQQYNVENGEGVFYPDLIVPGTRTAPDAEKGLPVDAAGEWLKSLLDGGEETLQGTVYQLAPGFPSGLSIDSDREGVITLFCYTVSGSENPGKHWVYGYLIEYYH